MNKMLILTILFIGILLITIHIVKESTHCQKERIIYKYLPRNFNDDQNNEPSVTEIFDAMFTQPSPWIASINDIDHRKQEEVNKYFISQV